MAASTRVARRAQQKAATTAPAPAAQAPMAASTSSSFSVLSLRIGARAPYLRYLFVKPLTDGGADVPRDRALFVAGIPAGVSQAGVLEALFEQFGGVARVAVHGSQTSAVVLYDDDDGRAAVLQAAADGAVLSLDRLPTQPAAAPSSGSGSFGLKAAVEAHKAALAPGNDALQRALDEWMARYEEAEAARKAAAAAALEGDGWTVVARHKGRKKNVGEGGITVGAVAAAAAQSHADAKAAAGAGGKGQALDDFYRFQKRDRSRSALLDLQAKFAEDKKRIAALKASRKFKPY